MTKILPSLLFAIVVLFAGHAFALDLHGARTSGLVGEMQDGYVAAVKPSADVNALVTDVNTKRKVEYGKISAQNGQPVSVVGQLAAQQIIGGLPAGSFYKGSDGSWKKK